MYKNKTVCVVVPAYNEEKLIGRVIETMPEFVDKIVVLDDLSNEKSSLFPFRPLKPKKQKRVSEELAQV